jgi:phytoene desaturase
MAKKCIIIGAGIGGLATAGLLAKAGYDVHVFETHDRAGGRAGTFEQDGFRFDTGPSWYLMPEVFEHYFDLMDEPIHEWLDLKRLSPAYKVFFENHQPVTIVGDVAKDAETFEQIEAGGGRALKKYVAQSEKIYRLSLNHFLYTNFQSLRDFMKWPIIKTSFQLPILLLRSIDSYVSSFVRDKRLQQILEYPTVFLGTSPFTAPAMYSLMSALDFKDGVFYPQGGIYKIIESLEAIAIKNGVTFHFNAEVESIVTENGEARGVTVGGSVYEADIVISNADLHFTETTLLSERDRSYDEGYWSNKEAGPSALLMYLGVRGRLPDLEHHNLLFVDDWKKNFDDIYERKLLPEKASIYICKPSHTDASVAPVGDENVFVLVPLPSGISMDGDETERVALKYLTQIRDMTGIDLGKDAIVKNYFSPDDFGSLYHSWQNSMLGQSHLLKQSAFFRTPNKSRKVSGLYYVGGSTVPGIGLPMCLIGAELVYKRIIRDKQGGKIVSVQRQGESL